MKDNKFYIEKANDTIIKIEDYQKSNFCDDRTYTIKELILETELLFFGYSKSYPALFDIKKMKENYQGRELDFTSVIIKNLHSHLSMFKIFISDHN